MVPTKGASEEAEHPARAVAVSRAQGSVVVLGPRRMLFLSSAPDALRSECPLPCPTPPAAEPGIATIGAKPPRESRVCSVTCPPMCCIGEDRRTQAKSFSWMDGGAIATGAGWALGFLDAASKMMYSGFEGVGRWYPGTLGTMITLIWGGGVLNMCNISAREDGGSDAEASSNGRLASTVDGQKRLHWARRGPNSQKRLKNAGKAPRSGQDTMTLSGRRSARLMTWTLGGVWGGAGGVLFPSRCWRHGQRTTESRLHGRLEGHTPLASTRLCHPEARGKADWSCRPPPAPRPVVGKFASFGGGLDA